MKRFLPMLLSPEGLMNLASWMVPISVTAVEPVSRSGCGCHAGTASGDTAAWLLALGTLGLFAARRARR